MTTSVKKTSPRLGGSGSGASSSSSSPPPTTNSTPNKKSRPSPKATYVISTPSTRSGKISGGENNNSVSGTTTAGVTSTATTTCGRVTRSSHKSMVVSTPPPPPSPRLPPTSSSSTIVTRSASRSPSVTKKKGAGRGSSSDDGGEIISKSKIKLEQEDPMMPLDSPNNDAQDADAAVAVAASEGKDAPLLGASIKDDPCAPNIEAVAVSILGNASEGTASSTNEQLAVIKATTLTNNDQDINAGSGPVHKIQQENQMKIPEKSTNVTFTTANPNGAMTALNTNMSHDKDSTDSPSFSMTLAISPSDTRRVFDASRTFNIEMQKLRDEMVNNNATTTTTTDGVKTPNNATKDSSDHAGYGEPKKKLAFQTLLLKAATNSRDALLSSFLAKMKASNAQQCELETCLLFFLDADKSTKLLAAFDILSSAPSVTEESAVMESKEENNASIKLEETSGERGGEQVDSMVCDDSKPSAKNNNSCRDPNNDFIASSTTKDFNEELAEMMIDDDTSSSKLVGRKGLIQLFQSFLSTISSCVHSEKEKDGSRAPTPTANNKSPASANTGRIEMDWDDATHNYGDWKGSDCTQQEIIEVATFAADNLIDYAMNGDGQSNTSSEKKDHANEKTKHVDKEGPIVSFDDFGKWYNSGGFSLVPWLELLDLSKWDFSEKSDSAGRSRQSSYKRSRPNEPFTPGITGAADLIGSPTAFFAAGAAIGAPTPQPKAALSPSPEIQSFSAIFGEMNESRTVLSFDFSGSAPNSSGQTNSKANGGSFHIDISEENLLMLRNLVRRTGLSSLTPQQVESELMKYARHEKRKYGDDVYVISRERFGEFIREIVPKDVSKQFDPTESNNFSNYFTNFFTCFDYSWSDLKKDEVNAKELMVGFSFFCAGNKSSKLAAAYDVLDVSKHGYLTQQGLLQYLRSYLTMLAGISLLSSSKDITTQIRKKLMSQKRHDAFLAVQNGARWTLGHFLKAFETEHQQMGSTRSNAVTFEDFAKWYTEGGYAVAPWLELLDLNKFLSLMPQEPVVLFTFPLANNRSLVVLRDDAQYVKSVVSELGLLSLTSEEIWSVLYTDVVASLPRGSKSKQSMSVKVNQTTFVQCMMRLLSKKIKLKSSSSNFSPEETLTNLFLSFDLEQSNQVALNQLMCGLTLLCGGKKSSKLVFAFGLFDGHDSKEVKSGKKKPSMGREDFLYFFRSFLIVMFSCCNQSLDLSADAVSQYISDTALSVTNDVMAFQWRTKKLDRVKFDHFSEWYNEGGFETAHWLELLDLNKWVLVDDGVDPQVQQEPPVPPTPAPVPAASDESPNHGFRALLASPQAINVPIRAPADAGCTPAPPDDASFFDDLDMSAVDAEADEMDLILQHDDGHTEHDVAVTEQANENANYFDPAATSSPSQATPQNAINFHLLTHDHHRGYMISIGPSQVNLLNRLVTETGLCKTDAATACKFILEEARSRRQNHECTISKRSFDIAMNNVFSHTSRSLSTPISNSTQLELAEFLKNLFAAFDRYNADSINAFELACGFTVLCGGNKSDKLEHVFELLDEDKDSLLSRQDITRFLQSFLILLMHVSSSFTLLDGGACGNDNSTITRAIETGSEWATSQVFDAMAQTTGNSNIRFDDFADWYTKGGYQSIPWLELLDLRKWVLGEA